MVSEKSLTHSHLSRPSRGLRLIEAAFGFAAACALFTVTAPVRAQTSGQPEADTQTVTITSTTARKRNELAQDVPVSMDIIGGKDLKDAGITRIKDIQATVPGLVIETRESSGKISLRGVGTGDVGLGTDQSVAVHVDGVYQVHGSAGLARAFDMDRVEVLRGPQGTLYGRNATAGVINLVSRAPQMKFGAEADVSVGSFGLRQAQATLNVPLGMDTAVRFALISSDDDGSIKNLAVAGDKLRYLDTFTGVRGRLRTKLADVGVDLSVQYINDRSAGALIPNPEIEGVGLGATKAESYELGYAPDGKPTFSSRNLAVSLQLTKDLPNNMKLTATTGYGEHKGGQSFKLAYPGRPFGLALTINEPADQWSQELQLSGYNDRMDWVAGLFYITFDGADQRLASFYKAGFNLFDTDAKAGGSSTALYGDVNYRLSPALRLNVGLRHTKDKKDGVASSQSDVGYTVNPPEYASKSWSATTGRVGLDWKMNKSTMLFGSLSTGYKSGGVIPNYDPLKPFDVYKPETLTALEVGQKTTFANNAGLFNLSAFAYDYKDKVEFYSPAPNTFGFYNAPKARVTGVDAFVDLRLAKHVRWDLNASWLNAKFKDFPADLSVYDPATGEVVKIVPTNYAGNRIARAPKFSATTGLVLERLPVAGVGLAQVRLEYVYRSQVFMDFTNDPLFSTPSINMVNLSARLDSTSGKWYAYFAGRNLTDKRWIDAAVPSGPGFAAVNSGRTWQLGGGLRF